MKNHFDQENLLAEVLAEASPAEFREAMLRQTLRLARQRRRRRQIRRAGGVAGMAMTLALLILWQNHPEKVPVSPSPAKTAIKKSYQLVETQPLPTGAVVSNDEFSSVKVVSSKTAVTQVATVGGGYRLINDEQLLALIGPRPTILIRTGPNSEELVFADPQDQKRFLGN